MSTNTGNSVFEFIYGENNQKLGLTTQVQLAEYPDLIVENITLPETAYEGTEVEFSWSVRNQSGKNATGNWIDSVRLISLDGSKSPIYLGNYSYTQGLEIGKTYTRTEKVGLPSRLEGAWRLEVVTNADLGKNTNSQIYEHAAARLNNRLISDDILRVDLNPRPDLRVTKIEAPEKIIAGGKGSVKFTVSNMGPLVTSSQWKDSVYLSLDGKLSSDDMLIGRYDSGSALAPTQSYTTITDEFTVPLRYRGDVYIIVVSDSGNSIDEYPNENNNIRVEKLYVEPTPFADIVTSDVIAPDQASHGSKITVDYKVSNKGSAKTQGDQSSINSWIDSVWLTVDKRQPDPSKGDKKLGDIRHTGLLEVGEDYLGQITVTIPEGTYSGKYYITVWSDTYDAILEDTLATNINLDDPTQVDNNNYKARAIDILGFSPPDFTVVDIQAPVQAVAGGSYQFSYTVKNRADEFEGTWTDEVWLADNADLSKATIRWKLGEFIQTRKLGYNETYTVEQVIPLLAPSVTGLQLVVQTNSKQLKDTNDKVKQEKVKENNIAAVASRVTAAISDLAVTNVLVDQQVFSGELVNVSWTVENKGADVWSGTQLWTDYILISAYPEYRPEYATVIGSVVHSNAQGLKAGASYTTTGKFNVPVGYDGQYYIYVFSDAKLDSNGRLYFLPDNTSGQYNEATLESYQKAVFENNLIQNNVALTSLDIIYREPDLVIQDIQISNSNPNSGETVTVTWVVKNEGTRDTRVTGWYDGIYLSIDQTIDMSDYPVVDRGSEYEYRFKIKQTLIRNVEGKIDVLKVGQSYTQSATFTLPTAIGGHFNIIIKADTNYVKDYDQPVSSSIRKSLDVIDKIPFYDQGAVLEFKDEGNNEKSIALTINYVSPPDLQVSTVTSPTSVISGQKVDISYIVKNLGGKTPSDQGSWTDLIYLSSDRVLDLNKDKLLGFVNHSGGLAANAEYSASIQAQISTEMSGTYYVFVVTDPAYYRDGATGSVLEFENDLNNTLAAEQPLLIIQPDPVDLQVSDIVLPAQTKTGEKIRVEYIVKNVADYQAHGQWSDAVYLSRNNTWDNQDILLGRFTHQGGLAAQQQYTGFIEALLPTVQDGQWYIVVRPDIYNEVYEGSIVYTETGLNIAPAEANNEAASASTFTVTVPKLLLNTNTDLTLSSGDQYLYKLEVGLGETLRVRLDSSALSGSNEIYIRYEGVPSTGQYDYAYTLANSPDQELLVPTTKAGTYYILVKSSNSAKNTPAKIIAETLPLSITKVTPDQGGTGTNDYRWVTMDIYGAQFSAGALVKLSRPGVFEIEPERWQVLDATHIRAVFDLRQVPHGLYDIVVTNPNGDRIVEPYRYLVERAIEPDVTIGLGGASQIAPGETGNYSVSLQSLTNVDTPYVRLDIGAVEMGYNESRPLHETAPLLEAYHQTEKKQRMAMK